MLNSTRWASSAVMEPICGSVRRAIFALLVLVAAVLLPATAARAEEVAVQRHVTVRALPNRNSEVVKFPDIGEHLTLLDGGVRSHGYYHVQVADGRVGWVYYTFVKPLPPSAAAAFTDADRLIVHFIDVDQGNSALLEFPCGAILIDAGGRTEGDVDHLIATLDAFFARRTDLNHRLDAVFITHTHVDHNRGLKRLAERFAIRAYIHNGLVNGSGRVNASWMLGTAVGRGTAVLAVTEDSFAAAAKSVTGPTIDPLACARVDPEISILSGSYHDNPGWPDGEFDNGNNHSLVIRVAYGQGKFLFTGDLEEPAIETLIERMSGTDLLNVDMYVVGHHGSANGTTRAFLAAMSPQMALISTGKTAAHSPWTAWMYGHPRRTIVKMIDDAISRPRVPKVTIRVADGAKQFSNYELRDAIYGTAWDGDVDVIAAPDATFIVQP